MEPLQERLHALARWAAMSSQPRLLLPVKMLYPQVKTGPVAYCLVHDTDSCLLLASELLSLTPTRSNATVVGRDLFDVITDNGLGFPLLLELPDALLKVGQRVLQPLWTLIEVPRALFLKHCFETHALRIIRWGGGGLKQLRMIRQSGSSLRPGSCTHSVWTSSAAAGSGLLTRQLASRQLSCCTSWACSATSCCPRSSLP